MERLKKIEEQMDNANAKHGSRFKYCLYCEAREYDHKGVIHTKDCAITIIRKLINEKETENLTD